MRVAVVHYHYRPGGVTRVVQSALASLQGRGVQTVAICGEPCADAPFAVRVQPGLGYSQPNEKLFPGPLWYSLRMTARQALGGEPDLWHFHNHALGKNSAIGEVVDKMATTAPVLLQFHDFAEDGRAANYAMLRARMHDISRLYPQGAQVHYAAINTRDHGFLCQSGFNAQNVHLLPNPVDVAEAAQGLGAGNVAGLPFTSTPDSCPQGQQEWGGRVASAEQGRGLLRFGADAQGATDHVRAGQKLYLYPTRAIRRKNLGELLLWAVLGAGDGSRAGADSAEGSALYATTLSPANSQARPVYERWVAFAGRLGLPVVFGVGEGRGAPSFGQLMARADAVLTTSIAEGFGMAFLEPWLFGRRVLGRNLPEITADFAQKGIDLGGLYSGLMVPSELISLQQLRHSLHKGLERVYHAYGRSLPQNAAEACLAAAGDGNGRIDFGILDETLQEEVITRLHGSAELRSLVSPAVLECAFPPQPQANAAAVEAHYGLAAYGETLAGLYRKVADSKRQTLSYPDPALLLDKFLAPERFSLLRD